MKVMWFHTILDPLCDLELRSCPWTFRVKFWNSCTPEMGWPIIIEWKGCDSANCWTHYVTLTSELTYDPELGFSRCNMVFTESMHCNKPNITYLLRYRRVNWHRTKGIRAGNNAGPSKQPLTLTSSMTWISKSNLRIVVFQQWTDLLKWNKRDVNCVTSSMTLTLGFSWLILIIKLYLRNHFRYYFSA